MTIKNSMHPICLMIYYLQIVLVILIEKQVPCIALHCIIDMYLYMCILHTYATRARLFHIAHIDLNRF